MLNGISIILPGFNEECEVKKTVALYQQALRLASKYSSYQIILINDGSTDQTGKMMDTAASEDTSLTVIHHKINLGLGNSYKAGISAVKYNHVCLSYCASALTPESLSMMIDQSENNQLVTTYVVQHEDLPRGAFRHFVSKVFVVFLNLLAGSNLKYFNGAIVCPTRLLKSLKIFSRASGTQAEVTVKLLLLGVKHSEVGLDVPMPWSRGGHTRSLRIKNIVRVLHLVAHLILFKFKILFFRKRTAVSQWEVV
jgi:glycosyltransferase involved in cell wall biosynthesis